MTGRFSFPDENDDAGIMRRSDEIIIRLHRLTGEEGEPDLVCGSFEIHGSLGNIDNGADAADLLFAKDLLDRFEKVQK